LGAKYIITRNPARYPDKSFISLAQFDNLYVIKDLNTLPVGVAYSHVLSKTVFNALQGNEEKSLALLKACVVEDSLVSRYQDFLKLSKEDGSVLELPDWNYYEAIYLLKRDTFQTIHYSPSWFVGSISIKHPKILFFSIPFSPEWKVWVDGERRESFVSHIGFTGILLEPGEHEIELKYTPRYFKTGLVISPIAFIALILVLIIKKKRNLT
jgi:hypothetical protein